jgi:aryl-alcohol dehydrogenase-like predicted oxidoreductase
MLHKPGVTCPIVGTSRLQHLEEAVAAVGVRLSQEDIGHLEEPYRPKRVLGF